MERHTGPLFDAAYAAENAYWEACRRRNDLAEAAWLRYGRAVFSVRLGRRPSVAPATMAGWDAHQRAHERRGAQCAALWTTFERLWRDAVLDRYGCEPGEVQR